MPQLSDKSYSESSIQTIPIYNQLGEEWFPYRQQHHRGHRRDNTTPSIMRQLSEEGEW
jgi:hypothetical protein